MVFQVCLSVPLSVPHTDWVNTSSGWDIDIIFLDTINDCFLEQLILEPTVGEALLTLINTQDQVQKVSVGELLCNNDHNIIRFSAFAEGVSQKFYYANI